jgi:hypothetical protein
VDDKKKIELPKIEIRAAGFVVNPPSSEEDNQGLSDKEDEV